MLFLDVNVLVNAYRPTRNPGATEIHHWLLPRLSGSESMGVSEMVLASVVRIVTNGRIFAEPATPADAMTFADAILAAPAVEVVRPGSRHWTLFRDLVLRHRLRANDVPDAYLAALTMERRARLVTSDRGFARFEGLVTVDPLA